ncbi:MAG: endo-1,4-beta-xylanase [Lachnospiraceae bacterium]|nr:endo-1,4-beta-xylanase [Lachnospiraceae bacterium]
MLRNGKKFRRGIGAVAMAAVMAVSGLTGGKITAKAAEMADVDIASYERLDELYGDYFKFGAACEAISHWNDGGKEIGNPQKEELLSTVFNSITCGNEMKPAYNFDAESESLFKIDPAATEMLEWAKANHMGMRGHTLLWHAQVDPSIFAKDYTALSNGMETKKDSAELDEDCLVDRDELLRRMKTYIYSMMEYTYKEGYAETIYAWDVVNEAADENQDDGFRRSYWYKIIGPDFLYYAFLYAREAETLYAAQYADLYGLNAETDDLSPIMPKLFYNDYNEWFDNKSDAIINFLTKEKWNENHAKVKSDVIKPDGDGTIYGDGLIDGIGMQGHLSDTQDIDQYMKALRKYSAVVDEVQITELDVGCSKTDENVWLFQAKFYYDFFARLIEEVKAGAKLTSVTVWGLTDDASWRRDANPLLFTGKLERKPAFEAVVMAAKGEEFTMTLQDTLGDVEDMLISFEPYVEAGKAVSVEPKDVGIIGRGTGHQAKLKLVQKINHTEDAAIGFSLKVSRQEQDASMKLNISRYAGMNVTVTAYVMAEDKKIRMGWEISESTQLLEADAIPEDWAELSVNVTVPEDAPAAFIYLETDGAADFYVDDISVVINEDGAPAGAESAAAGDNGESVTNDEEGAATGNTGDAAAENAEDAGNANDAAAADEDRASGSTGIFGTMAVVAVIVIAAGAAGAAWYAKKKSQNKKEGE